jgi:hypothetical protein
MKNEALYHKSVGILAKAYVDNTLVHGSCFACAVGNLIAGNCGYTFGHSDFQKGNICWNEVEHPVWIRAIRTVNDNGNHVQILDLIRYIVDYCVSDQIDSTGYSFDELARIEYAFETNYTGHDPMFTALLGVIDVLDDIHEVEKEVSIVSRDKFQLA